MKNAVFMVAIVAAFSSTSVFGRSIDEFVDEVMKSGRTIDKAREVVSSLGLNCGTPDQWEIFYDEMVKLLKNLGRVTTEAGLQLAVKKDFPTVCHVLTQPQLNSYAEGTKRSSSDRCISRGPWGNCLLREFTDIEQPQPHYYWPKYFVEVMEKGNDSHHAFAENNLLYSKSRTLADSLASSIDTGGATELVAYVLGGRHLLGSIGIETGVVSETELARTKALEPFERMRMRASRSSTQPNFEATIWPVGLSETIAENLTVCGPQLKENGKHPGGYSWPVKGVPMTCPVAMSRDAMQFWDTGMLDYLDPQAVAQMGVSANPVACGVAAAMDQFGSMQGGKRENVGDQSSVDAGLSGMASKWRSAMRPCSYPILGNAEALMGKVISLTDAVKWSGPYCTVWGSLAPRNSTAVFNNDYNYANAGLKFKTMAHEVFGIPRGAEERWSLAYPWEGPGASNVGGKFSDWYSSVLDQVNNASKSLGLDLPESSGESRSEGLYSAGHPIMVDASYTGKFIADRTAQLSREFAYIGGLSASSITARKQAMKECRRRNCSDSEEAAAGIAAAAAPWVAAETVRAKRGHVEGASELSGDRRIYTVWEKVQCTAPTQKLTVKVRGHVIAKKYNSCRDAIRFEVYKYVQLELLRKFCDFLGEPVGKPWLSD